MKRATNQKKKNEDKTGEMEMEVESPQPSGLRNIFSFTERKREGRKKDKHSALLYSSTAAGA